MDLGFAFLLKKFISVFLLPISISIILLLFAFYLHYKKSHRKGHFFTGLSLVFIIIISYAPFASMLLSPLEKQYKKLEIIPPNVNYILLLGGDKKQRAWEVLRLYHLMDNPIIISSGYSRKGESEASKTAKLLLESGIPKNNIYMQGKAKDTKEEAIAVKKYLKGKAFILVTSAYHMPRAMLLFKKEGLDPIPAPTDFDDKTQSTSLSFFSAKYLFKTQRALHEYIGLLYLKIKDII